MFLCAFFVIHVFFACIGLALPGANGLINQPAHHRHHYHNKRAATSPPVSQPTYLHQGFVSWEDGRLSTNSMFKSSAALDSCFADSPTFAVDNAAVSVTSAAFSSVKASATARKVPRDLPNPLSDFLASFAGAFAPDFSAALGPLQSAAETNLAGISLIRSAAPSVIPTADIIAPAQSAAEPVLSNLFGELISAAQPLVNGAATVLPAAAEPIASLVNPLESAVLPPVESAIGPLVSAIAPAVVAALAPAVSQLSSPLGPIESGLIQPLEQAVAPLLSDIVGQAVSALTGIEQPVASLIEPVVGVLDSAVLPLVTSVVSAVWPAIGPAITPLNPIVCALMPAEVSLGLNATGLIPVECVSITSGNVIPISTGIATASIPVTTTMNTVIVPASATTASAPASGGISKTSFAPPAVCSNPQRTASTSQLAANTTVATLLGCSANVSPLSAVIPLASSFKPDATSDSSLSSMNCFSVDETSPTPAAAQPPANTQTLVDGKSQSQVLTTNAAQSTVLKPMVTSTLSTQLPLSSAAADISHNGASTLPAASSLPSAAILPSPTITPGPQTSQSGLILLSYGSQTVSFPAVMLPGGGMVASFMGSVFALPATAAANQLMPRMEPVPVNSNFDFNGFASELASKLSDAVKSGGRQFYYSKDQQVLASSSKSAFRQPAAPAQPKNQASADRSAGPAFDEHANGQDAGAQLQISTCPDAEGETFISDVGNTYSIVCDTNWIGRDVEYLGAGSFDACVDACEALNAGLHYTACAAALFVHDAPSGAADCYLKSATDNPTKSSSSYTFQAAVLKTSPSLASGRPKNETPDISQTPASGGDQRSATKSSLTSLALRSSAASSASLDTNQGDTVPSSYPTAESIPASISFASGSQVSTPSVSSTRKIDIATNQPATDYLSYTTVPTSSPTSSLGKRQDINSIPESILNGTGVDFALSLDDIDTSTGVLRSNAAAKDSLQPLSTVPRFSRDGGKGGMLNGENLFIFADTAVYTTENKDQNGHYVNFASSSVALDVGKHARSNDPLVLRDGPGEFASSEGALRGFAPLTEGESGFNTMAAQAGVHARYSIWPESSLIALNSTASMLVAPIVYSNTDVTTGAGKFTYAGNTLLTVTLDALSGPVAERSVGRLFDATQVEWGNIGGLRSWGPSGVGGNDGYVYLFGNVRGGLLAARAEPSSLGDPLSYSFWSGSSWTNDPLEDDSEAYFLEGSFMDADIFYSPRHLTFIAVYMNIYGDSTLYWRYLKAPQALRPSYAGGVAGSDFAEALFKYDWSDEQTLVTAGTGLSGDYSYAAGVHLGYFGQDDIMYGGDKMLLTWTSPTGQDPASKNSAYQLGTGVVTWT